MTFRTKTTLHSACPKIIYPYDIGSVILLQLSYSPSSSSCTIMQVTGREINVTIMSRVVQKDLGMITEKRHNHMFWIRDSPSFWDE